MATYSEVYYSFVGGKERFWKIFTIQQFATVVVSLFLVSYGNPMMALVLYILITFILILIPIIIIFILLCIYFVLKIL